MSTDQVTTAQNHNWRSRWIVSGGIGFCAALAYAERFTGVWTWSRAAQIILVVYLLPFFALAAHGLVFKGAWDRLPYLSSRRKYIWLLASVLVGCLIVVATPLDFTIPGMPALFIRLSVPAGIWRTLWNAVIISAYAVTLAVPVYFASVWLVARPASLQGPETVSQWTWLYYAIACAVVWAFWLLVFWPGVMSGDSVGQWAQVLKGDYNDWHPAFHTMSMWLVTRLWLSPAAVALTQIASLSAVVGYALMRFRQWCFPSRWIWIIWLVLILSPANSVMVITLWKDIPYSIAFLMLVLLVLEIVISDGHWLKRRGNWLWLGVVAAFVALFRLNGPPAAFGACTILMIAYRQYWRRAGAALALALVIWVGVRGPLYSAVGVKPSEVSGWLWVLVHEAAAHLDAGTPMTSEERDLLSQIRPLDDKWRYDCYAVTVPAFDGRLSRKALEGNKWELVRVAGDLMLRQPQVSLDRIICSSSLIWRITREPNRYDYGPGLGYNDQGKLVYIPVAAEFGLYPQSKIPELVEPLGRLVVLSAHIWDLLWLTWRSAIYLYVALASAVVASLRSRRWQYMLVMAPILFHSIFLAFVALDQDFRLQYPVYLVGLVLGGFLLFGVPLRGARPSMTAMVPVPVDREPGDPNASAT